MWNQRVYIGLIDAMYQKWKIVLLKRNFSNLFTRIETLPFECIPPRQDFADLLATQVLVLRMLGQVIQAKGNRWKVTHPCIYTQDLIVVITSPRFSFKV